MLTQVEIFLFEGKILFPGGWTFQWLTHDQRDDIQVTCGGALIDRLCSPLVTPTSPLWLHFLLLTSPRTYFCKTSTTFSLSFFLS